MNKTNRIRVIHKFGNHQGMVVYDKDYIAPTLTQGFGAGGGKPMVIVEYKPKEKDNVKNR